MFKTSTRISGFCHMRQAGLLFPALAASTCTKAQLEKVFSEDLSLATALESAGFGVENHGKLVQEHATCSARNYPTLLRGFMKPMIVSEKNPL